MQPAIQPAMQPAIQPAQRPDRARHTEGDAQSAFGRQRVAKAADVHAKADREQLRALLEGVGARVQRIGLRLDAGAVLGLHAPHRVLQAPALGARAVRLCLLLGRQRRIAAAAPRGAGVGRAHLRLQFPALRFLLGRQLLQCFHLAQQFAPLLAARVGFLGREAVQEAVAHASPECADRRAAAHGRAAACHRIGAVGRAPLERPHRLRQPGHQRGMRPLVEVELGGRQRAYAIDAVGARNWRGTQRRCQRQRQQQNTIDRATHGEALR